MQVTQSKSQAGRGRGHDQSTIGLVVCAIGSFRIDERPASRASKVVCKRRRRVWLRAERANDRAILSPEIWI